jgi:hypothetical protein
MTSMMGASGFGSSSWPSAATASSGLEAGFVYPLGLLSRKVG